MKIPRDLFASIIMFRNIARKIIRGLARAETPHVYLGKDQHLCYSYDDLFKREIVFSEHTPYAVLRQQRTREKDHIFYRLFATDTYHEHYISLKGNFEILPAINKDGLTHITVEEKTLDTGAFIREMEVPEFSDGVEFSTLHMNRKYPSLKVNLFTRVPGGSMRIRKTSDKSRRGRKEVTWEYEVVFQGRTYSGQDRFVYSRRDHAIMGAIDMKNIPALEGDSEESADFSYNTSVSGALSVNLEMAPICSPYLNITREYLNNGSVQLDSSLASYLGDFTVSSKLECKKENFTEKPADSRQISAISVRSRGHKLCQSNASAGDSARIQVIKDIQEKNDGNKLTKYLRNLEYRLIFKDGNDAHLGTILDCDLKRKQHAVSKIDDLLDAKFEPADNDT